LHFAAVNGITSIRKSADCKKVVMFSLATTLHLICMYFLVRISYACVWYNTYNVFFEDCIMSSVYYVASYFVLCYVAILNVISWCSHIFSVICDFVSVWLADVEDWSRDLPVRDKRSSTVLPSVYDLMTGTVQSSTTDFRRTFTGIVTMQTSFIYLIQSK